MLPNRIVERKSIKQSYGLFFRCFNTKENNWKLVYHVLRYVEIEVIDRGEGESEAFSKIVASQRWLVSNRERITVLPKRGKRGFVESKTSTDESSIMFAATTANA